MRYVLIDTYHTSEDEAYVCDTLADVETELTGRYDSDKLAELMNEDRIQLFTLGERVSIELQPAKLTIANVTDIPLPLAGESKSDYIRRLSLSNSVVR